MTTDPRTPTEQTYGDLQAAYDHFNATLFGGELPPCLITLQRKNRRVMGYYSSDRFGHRTEDRTTDEIAMNPMHFGTANEIEPLQTLVHEMCHLWQNHFGKPSRNGYHNKEWSGKMQAIGLMPTSTGGPGGKVVGQKMSDYPIDGGPFEIEARKLLENDFRIAWYDLDADLMRTQLAGSADAGESNDDGEAGGEEEAEPQSGKRVKFTCPECHANAWGKPSLQITCAPCGVPFESAC